MTANRGTGDGPRDDSVALEDRVGTGDGRAFSPSVARNRQPILEVVLSHFPREGAVLEIGSGTGEHAVQAATAMPALTWFPSDPNADARASISAWVEATRLPNLLQPIDLDTRREIWGVEQHAPFDVMVAINLIHISPWESLLGLLTGAGRMLSAGGFLYIYGPFKIHGRHTAPSNATFDQSLRASNSSWGVRDLGEIEAEARERGLVLGKVIEMPSNNLSVFFRKEL